jgi:putative ABC transport system ATP-binding protein
MPALVVQVTDVSKRYWRGSVEVQALHEVSFDLPRGSTLAVMGPSGSGKTSLLNILAGLDRPSSGMILIAGTRVHELDSEAATTFRRRHIGFVFQFFNLLPTLSARENVELPLLAERMPRRQVEDRAAEALEAVGMDHRLDHRPSEMSGGEQQRVAIARALVMQPALLLADEPTGNLDTATGDMVLALLRTMVEMRGLSIVMVTHSQAAAAAMDRTLVIRDGHLLRQDAIAAPSSPAPR